jgi:hypothetical protein
MSGPTIVITGTITGTLTTTRSVIKAARVTRFTTIAKIPANLPKAFLITSANAEGHGARRRFLRMRSSA